MNSVKALLFAFPLLLLAFALEPHKAFAEESSTDDIVVAKSIDQCANSYLFCLESCSNQHNRCKGGGGSDKSHCSSFYTQCQGGCKGAWNSCIGTYSKIWTDPANVAGGKVSIRKPLNKLGRGKAIVLYKDGTWEYRQAEDTNKQAEKNIQLTSFDKDSEGTWKNEGCPRLCPRKVRYCTERLSDEKCKLWDYKTEWYCCAP